MWGNNELSKWDIAIQLEEPQKYVGERQFAHYCTKAVVALIAISVGTRTVSPAQSSLSER